MTTMMHWFEQLPYRQLRFSALLAGLVTVGFSTRAAVRVALMDFSTDDNSYRSIQAAADLTSL